jgi:predicted membrane metal-binding protein
MKRLIEKMKKWQLSKLIINMLIFYVALSLSILWVIVDFMAYGKNLIWQSYVLFAVCAVLSVIFFKKICCHLVKIKRGGFDC